MKRTTKTEAVNIMLGTIGESPVSDIDSNSGVDVAIAKDILDEVSREVQTDGWRFNTEYDVPLSRDNNNEIQLTENMAQVRFQKRDWSSSLEPVIRGNRLYNVRERTYAFDKDLEAEEVVYLLDFDEIPEYVRYYIAVRAARRFQARYVGSDKHNQFSMRDEVEARSIAVGAENVSGNYNIFDEPEFGTILRERLPRRYF